VGRFEDDDLWEKSLKKEREQQNRRKQLERYIQTLF
jgi:hypothetical protein